jgi:hypothetical protein
MKRADQLLPVLVKACPNLERLVISSGDVTEKGAEAISKFRKLKRLIADDTEIASDFFHDRKFSEELTHLDLDGTNVDSTVIASLPSSVTHLRLTGTKVDENAIPDLLKRKKLEWLHVPARRFSHKQLDRLKEGMPQTDIDTGGAFSFGGF